VLSAANKVLSLVTAEDSRSTLLRSYQYRHFLPEFVDFSVAVREIHGRATGWGCLAGEAGGYADRPCVQCSDSFATSVQYEAQRNLSPVSSDSDAVGRCWVLFD
jgi:hypothetical protein